jgi:hypothetical protein
MRSHRVKKRGKLLTNQTTVIVDITIRKTALVRAAEQFCFVHEVVSMKQAILKYLPTAKQVVDILTKPLEANIFSFLRDKLGFSRGDVLE